MTHTELFTKLREIREKMQWSKARVARGLRIDPKSFEAWDEGERLLNLEKVSDWASVLGYDVVLTLKKKKNEKT